MERRFRAIGRRVFLLWGTFDLHAALALRLNKRECTPYRASPPKRCPPPQRCRTASAGSRSDVGVAPDWRVLADKPVPPPRVEDEAARLGTLNKARKRGGVLRGFGRRRCGGACRGRYTDINHLHPSVSVVHLEFLMTHHI